jgi:hypothetical protein
MRRDQLFVDAPGDERLERRPSTWCTKSIKPPLRQVWNTWGKMKAEQIGQGEDVVADAAAIGVMGRDIQVGFVVSNPSMTWAASPEGRIVSCAPVRAPTGG